MNIIAGERKGTVLAAPKGMDTRPTQAKVKESLFNILQVYVPEAHVLDLFGGSGSLAFEALSRGAADACLSDCDRRALDCIKKNAEKLRYTEKIRLYPYEWRLALQKMKGEVSPFDLVFLDPPYRMTDLKEICSAIQGLGLLADGAVLALEHRTGEGILPDSPFEFFKERVYSDTSIHFYFYHNI